MALIVTDKRSTICFTKELTQAMELVSLVNKPVVVGSYSFIAHPYPGDIDMFEDICEKGTANQACLYFQNKFQEMAQRIQSRKNTYLSDFKVGYDMRYQVDVNGSFEEIRDQLKELYLHQLLTRSEFANLLHTLKVSKKDFKELVRNKQVIRWSLKEIVKGFKILPGNHKIYLSEALGQQTIVKIDIITLVNGFYMEITNLFKLSSRDHSGQLIHLTQPDSDYQESLIQDLKKYSDPSLGKYLKLTKRLWSLSILIQDKSALKKIKPLLESGVARLGQLCALIETLLILFQKTKIPLVTALEQIQRLNFIISSVSYHILSQSSTEYLCQQIHDLEKIKSLPHIINKLEHIHDILHKVVHAQTYKYLKQTKLMKKIKSFTMDK